MLFPIRLLATLLTGGWLSGSLLALDLSGTVFDEAGRRYRLDPLLLYAVALVESGYGSEKQGVRPWAWALRSSRGSVYAKDRAEAEQVLSTLLGDGLLNVDIGLAQVNLRWHGHRIRQPADLLDPVTNLSVSADILRDALASAPGDLALGVARYHSWLDHDKGERYARRVLRIYQQLSDIR